MARSGRPVLDGLTIALANPAAFLFYAAFFPQFIDPGYSVFRQMIVLSAVYVCLAFTFDSLCVLTAARVRLLAGCARVGIFAELGSSAVYLAIAAVAVLRFFEVAK